MKLLEVLKENNLLQHVRENEKDIKNLKLDSYTKVDDVTFNTTIGKNNYKVYAHNYWCIDNGKILWCYTVEKNKERVINYPKSIAWLGTILVNKQRYLIPEVS